MYTTLNASKQVIYLKNVDTYDYLKPWTEEERKHILFQF